MMTSLLGSIARLLFLPMLVVSCALLVGGYSGVGGGFAGGALAGAAVVLQRLAFGPKVAQALISRSGRRISLCAGLLVTVLYGLAASLGQGSFLSHYPAPGEHVTRLGALELHTALIFEAGVYVVVFAFVLEGAALVAPEPRTD